VLFADTSFLAALALRNDSNHVSARRLLDRFERERVCTSELVLGEMWTLLRKREGHRHALSWIDRVRATADLLVEPVDGALTAEAWAWLRVHDERNYSFVDATSFALMRKRRITDALAFDDDFIAAGFIELRA
jgi:predicted nucleic acid-binding protein